MTISRLIYAAEIIGSGHRVYPIDGAAILDESWSPYAQADFTIALPADPAVLEALDPRTGARMRVSVSQQFGTGLKVSDLTRTPNTYVTLWSNVIGTKPLSTWTGMYSQPYNRFGNRQSNSRRMDLGVRSRIIDFKAGTVVISLASDEALVQDMVNLDSTARVPATDSVHGAVALALSSIGAVATIEADDVEFEPGSAIWEPGDNAWSYVTGLVDAAGLRLWCDEKRLWHLAEPNIPTGDLLSFSASTAKEIEDTISRDEDAWYDAVQVTYRWTDSSGTEQVRYDTAHTGQPTKVLQIEYERPWPKAGAAQSILERANGRGRVESVTAVANPSAEPRTAMRVTLPSERVVVGYVSRVEWNFDSDEMRIQTRDLTEAARNAWALVPDGYAWQDAPIGTTWANFDIEDISIEE